MRAFSSAKALDAFFGDGGAAGAVQCQLQNGGAGGQRVAGQLGQTLGHGGAALGTVFQNFVHQAFIGEGQQCAGAPGRGIGQGGRAVPQFQNIRAVPLLPQGLHRAVGQGHIDAGGVFDTVGHK